MTGFQPVALPGKVIHDNRSAKLQKRSPRMFQSSSSVQTEHASRYLQQLCKHFAHKIPVEFTPETGECRFPFGSASLRADKERLTVEIEAADAEQRARAQEVIEVHLARFAFRETLGPMVWNEGREGSEKGAG